MSVNIYNSNPNATSEEENFSRVADRGSKLASDTIYSNTTSGLNSVNVQGAIDEIATSSYSEPTLIDTTNFQGHSGITNGIRLTKRAGVCQLTLLLDTKTTNFTKNTNYTVANLPSDCTPSTNVIQYGVAMRNSNTEDCIFRVSIAPNDNAISINFPRAVPSSTSQFLNISMTWICA